MHRRFAVLATVIALFVPAPARASLPPGEASWTDRHYRYLTVPSGLSAIKATFGEPCNGSVNDNAVLLLAMDNGKWYQVNFHRKLGGAESSNLDNDVVGHIYDKGYNRELKSGIWGYACRRKRNSTQWSVHAWGVAVDVNSAYEYQSDSSCNTVTTWMGQIWIDHRWTWGRAWRDCMHFQYATAY